MCKYSSLSFHKKKQLTQSKIDCIIGGLFFPSSWHCHNIILFNELKRIDYTKVGPAFSKHILCVSRGNWFKTVKLHGRLKRFANRFMQQFSLFQINMVTHTQKTCKAKVNVGTNIFQFSNISLRKNGLLFGVIQARILPAFFGIWTECGEIRISPYSVRMRENAGKMRIRIIPNTDNFYAVYSQKCQKRSAVLWNATSVLLYLQPN